MLLEVRAPGFESLPLMNGLRGWIRTSGLLLPRQADWTGLSYTEVDTKKLVAADGFEPPASRLSGGRSIAEPCGACHGTGAGGTVDIPLTPMRAGFSPHPVNIHRPG